MAASAVEDSEEARRLLELECSVLEQVQEYAGCPLSDKARSQKLSSAIQGKLSQIRAVSRDLELMVEELDRWGIRAA